jgi:hypothetical protein
VPAVLVTQGYTWDFAKDVLDQVQQPPLPQVRCRQYCFAYNPVWVRPLWGPSRTPARVLQSHTTPAISHLLSSPRGLHQVVITNHRFAHSQSAAVTMPAFAADFAKNEGRYWRDLNDSAAKGAVNVHGVRATVPRYILSPQSLPGASGCAVMVETKQQHLSFVLPLLISVPGCSVRCRYLIFQGAKDMRGRKRRDQAWNAEQVGRSPPLPNPIHAFYRPLLHRPTPLPV